MKTTRLPQGAGSIKLDIDAADRMLTGFASAFVVRVGILGEKNARQNTGKGGDKTNAEIGLVHEKGSLADHIPRRSFLEMPLTNHMKQLAGAVKIIKKWVEDSIAAKNDPKAIWKTAHDDLGIEGTSIVQQAFVTRGDGTWAPNSPVTIALKSRNGHISDSPLIDTQELRKSIMHKVVTR